jgi:large subunit ribosomal protein L19
MNLNQIQKNLIGDKKIPPIKPGDIVRVVQEFEDGGSAKQQIFEGVVIATRGEGLSKTFTVRKVMAGVGVEKIYPLYSPTIKKIEVKKSSKVKRAKLYWLRDRFGKAARLTEKDLDPEVIKLMAEEEVIKSDSQKVSQKEVKSDKAEVDKEKIKKESAEKRSEAESSDLSASAKAKAEAESEGGEKNKDENKEEDKKSKAEPKKTAKSAKDKS